MYNISILEPCLSVPRSKPCIRSCGLSAVCPAVLTVNTGLPETLGKHQSPTCSMHLLQLPEK